MRIQAQSSIKAPLFKATSVDIPSTFLLQQEPGSLLWLLFPSGNWVNLFIPCTSQLGAGLSVLLMPHCHTQTTMPSFPLNTVSSKHMPPNYDPLTIPAELQLFTVFLVITNIHRFLDFILASFTVIILCINSSPSIIT